MSESSEEKKKRPLPQNLAGLKKNTPIQSDQFESMTELSSRAEPGELNPGSFDIQSQNQTFEIFQGEEIVASKRTKPGFEPGGKQDPGDAANQPQNTNTSRPAPLVTAPSVYNPRGLADTWTEESAAVEHHPPAPQAKVQKQREPDAAHYQLAKSLEGDCLELIKDLSQNIALLSALSEGEKRIELLLSLRAMVKDFDTTGPVATTAALICGYYRDSKEGDFDTSVEQEPYGLFAADRFALCEQKRQMQNVLPDGFEQFAPQIQSGFAVNQNFLLALHARLIDAWTGKSTSVADTVNELVRTGKEGFMVTFPGALAPIKVESAAQGELAFGSADIGGTASCYVALLEKAYGQYLALTMDKESRPTLITEAAWAAHSPTKAHLGLRLLTGRTPRLLQAPPYNQRKEWKETVAQALRQCRSQGQRVFVVLAKDDHPSRLDIRLPIGHAEQIKHAMIAFNGSAIELTSFDTKGSLESKTVTFDELFASALSFYAIID
ncbi:MAG: hypothetical protein KA392_09285 [Candidatus Obscuribacter sp.]|nr:hypothetical protein [Candidatus Obscuribacter sp.]MBP6349716.1 hypothetical protein [Candidatus Obscuribacter sp.]